MNIKNALLSIAGTSLILFAGSASAQSQVPVAVGSTYGHLEAVVAKITCVGQTKTAPAKATLEFNTEIERLRGSLNKNKLFAIGKLESPILPAPKTNPTLCAPDLENMSGTLTFTSEVDEKKRSATNTTTEKVNCSLKKNTICSGQLFFAKPNF